MELTYKCIIYAHYARSFRVPSDFVLSRNDSRSRQGNMSSLLFGSFHELRGNMSALLFGSFHELQGNMSSLMFGSFHELRRSNDR